VKNPGSPYWTGVIRKAAHPAITGEPFTSLTKELLVDLFPLVEREDQRVAYVVMHPEPYAELRGIGRTLDLDIETNPRLLQQGIVAYVYGATILVVRNAHGVVLVGERNIRQDGAVVGTELGVTAGRPWEGERSDWT